MPRILITGSREWANRRVTQFSIRDARVRLGGGDVTVVHGGARGADTMAGQEASQMPGVTVEVHEVNWSPLGYYDKTQGFARNQRMVDLGADVCLAYLVYGAGNRGTMDCIRRAKAAGIPVVELWT